MIIRAAASPCGHEDRDAFDITRLQLPASLLKDDCGEELAIRANGLTIRLSVEQGTLLKGPVCLDYRIRGRRHLQRRLLALRQFDAALRRGHVPPSLRGKARNVDRPDLILRALDALAVTSRARDVAMALFGAEKVHANWYHESDYLRSQTRRLMDRARHLAAGGYLGVFD